jgi:hypothetical protein
MFKTSCWRLCTNLLNYIKTLINYDYILRKAFCLFCHIEIYQIMGFPYVLLVPLESLWWVGIHKVISTCNASMIKFKLFSSVNFNQTKNWKSKKIAPIHSKKALMSKSNWISSIFITKKSIKIASYYLGRLFVCFFHIKISQTTWPLVLFLVTLESTW